MHQILSPSIMLHTIPNHHGTDINALVLNHNGNNYHFHGSTGDSIFVFTESIGIYLLTINKTNGYIGLNCFMAPEPDRLNSVFLDTPHQIKEVLSHKWESLAPAAIVRRLRNLMT